MKRFELIPKFTKKIGLAKCVGFAMGSTGRHEATFGSDMEMGLFCDVKLKEHDPIELEAAMHSDVNDVTWDTQTLLRSHIYYRDSMHETLTRACLTNIWLLLEATQKSNLFYIVLYKFIFQ